jgi:hypothetical protein
VGFCAAANQAPLGATGFYRCFRSLRLWKFLSHGSRRGLLSFRRSAAKMPTLVYFARKRSLTISKTVADFWPGVALNMLENKEKQAKID